MEGAGKAVQSVHHRPDVPHQGARSLPQSGSQPQSGSIGAEEPYRFKGLTPHGCGVRAAPQCGHVPQAFEEELFSGLHPAPPGQVSKAGTGHGPGQARPKALPQRSVVPRGPQSEGPFQRIGTALGTECACQSGSQRGGHLPRHSAGAAGRTLGGGAVVHDPHALAARVKDLNGRGVGGHAQTGGFPLDPRGGTRSAGALAVDEKLVRERMAGGMRSIGEKPHPRLAIGGHPPQLCAGKGVQVGHGDSFRVFIGQSGRAYGIPAA